MSQPPLDYPPQTSRPLDNFAVGGILYAVVQAIGYWVSTAIMFRVLPGHQAAVLLLLNGTWQYLYITPLHRQLQNRGRPRTAHGLLMVSYVYAAGMLLLLLRHFSVLF